MLSFYDWYADLPPASPQIWGDQTDVPESADWWNSSYLIIWGTNIPQTRTPDAHFMTEARYSGQKVVVVSPDYADHTKFADDWLAAQPGYRRRARDGDGPRDPQASSTSTGRCRTSSTTSRRYTDLPFLVTLRERERRVRRRPVPARSGSRRTRASSGRVEDRRARRTRRSSRSSRTARSASAGATRAWASGTSSSATSTGAVTATSAPDELVAVDLPRFDVGDDRGAGSIDPPRRTRRCGSAAGS